MRSSLFRMTRLARCLNMPPTLETTPLGGPSPCGDTRSLRYVPGSTYAVLRFT